MRLDTADALLTYMNEDPIGPSFASEVEGFLADTGIGERQFGAKAARDRAFVEKLRSGASLRLYTVERVRAWMRTNKRALMAQPQSGPGKSPPARGSQPVRHETPTATSADPRSGDARTPARTTRSRKVPRCSFRPGGRGLAHALGQDAHAPSCNRGRTRFLRFAGRIRYTRADLLEWAVARRQERTPE